MIICPGCGYHNSDGARFCSSCGTKLFKKCPKCGKEIPVSQNFCSSCGQDNTSKGIDEYVAAKREKTEKRSSVINKVIRIVSIIVAVICFLQFCAFMHDTVSYPGMYYSKALIDNRVEYYVGFKYQAGEMIYAFFDGNGNRLGVQDVKYFYDFDKMLRQGNVVSYSTNGHASLAVYSAIRNPKDIPESVLQRIEKNLGSTGERLTVKRVFRSFLNFDYPKLEPKSTKGYRSFVFAVNE